MVQREAHDIRKKKKRNSNDKKDKKQKRVKRNKKKSGGIRFPAKVLAPVGTFLQARLRKLEKRKKVIDKLAACLILQSYLEEDYEETL